MAALYPLARGEEALMQHPTVTQLAQTYGKTNAQVCPHLQTSVVAIFQPLTANQPHRFCCATAFSAAWRCSLSPG